ncbi:hypothetical protein GIB67_009680 [Kingdonia uniflora]|uniref:Uncharacterized protein n=1 Tax=Kingdonia uniflora TaxID=39325 RepID=A0A7J7LB44_9MAGN|nr:hypothetical protein GIB67_009680 [Kingdonia uniflora]
MAKGRKLTKLKSVIKKMQSFSGLNRNGSAISAANPSDNIDDHSFNENMVPGGFHHVYVGKSRRRYLISSDIIDHPLVRELVDMSGGSEEITVGCEVVLFEHLLWMLENADPQPESMDELVDFYAC